MSLKNTTFATMYIEKIILTNFKNYETVSLTLSEQLNCFVGLNGMGKTNLLDAIYYLCLCKSNFMPSDSDVILRGCDFLRLEGYFIKKGKREKIVAKVQARKKKIIERNDVAYKGLSEHIGFLPVVFFAPDDTLLAKEGSEERRRFIDTALSQIDNQYLTNLIFYNKIVEQRNAYLKNKESEGKQKDALLDTYDVQLLKPAQYIFEKRKNFVEKLTPIFNEIYAKIANSKEQVVINYESLLLTNDLGQLLSNCREKDRLLQRTTVGVHKDDVSFEMDSKPLKKFGSQGQLKSFVLALKLAQYEILRGVTGESPILLLDDIFDKLDDNRVNSLLQLLVNQSYGQIFITDTHRDRMEKIIATLNIDSQLVIVENGKVN
jgi:DNA replication and repair protein RecF